MIIIEHGGQYALLNDLLLMLTWHMALIIALAKKITSPQSVRYESRETDGPNIQCVIHNNILALNCPFSFILSPYISSHPHPSSATGLN